MALSGNLSPPLKPPLSCFHLVRLRGALARRANSGTRRGARGARSLDESPGRRRTLRPGPLRGPARSWLTTVRSIPNAIRPSLANERGAEQKEETGQRDTHGESAVRRCQIAAHGAPRGARRGPQGSRNHRFASFGAPSPLILRRAEGPSRRNEGRVAQTPDAEMRRGKGIRMSAVNEQRTPYLPLVGRFGVASCDAGVGGLLSPHPARSRSARPSPIKGRDKVAPVAKRVS